MLQFECQKKKEKENRTYLEIAILRIFQNDERCQYRILELTTNNKKFKHRNITVKLQKTKDEEKEKAAKIKEKLILKM